jgi:hypothetical protein
MQYEDFTPTTLMAAGANPLTLNTVCPDASGQTGFDGRSDLNVLLGLADHHRVVVFGQSALIGINGVQAPYASRMVCDVRWKLIVNYHADTDFPHAEFGLGTHWKVRKAMHSQQRNLPASPNVRRQNFTTSKTTRGNSGMWLRRLGMRPLWAVFVHSLRLGSKNRAPTRFGAKKRRVIVRKKTRTDLFPASI